MSTPALDTRFATAADVDWLTRQEYLAAEMIAGKIAANDYVVVERDGDRVGFLRLEHLWSAVPYIGLIRVAEAHRGQGVGRALLSFLEDHLRAHGHAFLLSSSQADEPEPQAWHRHMGFVECGIISGLNANGVGEIFFGNRYSISRSRANISTSTVPDGRCWSP